jgi:hypothetical protein
MSSRKAREAAREQATTQRQTAPAEEEDLPPAYSISTNNQETTIEQNTSFSRIIPGLPNIPFAAYAPAGSEVSNDLQTTWIVDAALCKSPQALAKVIAEQISIPPIPEIRIKGSQDGSEWTVGRDFDIRLNMMRYFIPRDGEPAWNWAKLISNGKPKSKASGLNSPIGGVDQWAKAFCADHSNDKM